MKITIHLQNFTITQAVRQKIRRRVLKLGRYFNAIIRVDVRIKKSSADKTNSYQCDLLLSKRGINPFTRSKGRTPEEAAGGAVEGMRKQLRKLKTARDRNIKKRVVVYKGR